ncbi:hypothetical protein DFO73_101659 [Cytobacillus oceanisediminis]|jgi:hypothetical protein|uniref:Uncharacterized protein n=1 Tax=Cytobacillus oceanisediminis TaxID=665099 RepID=A0A2V3AEZ8_9BACI|nr:hypothetical protein DFO73_101659 [Cytobacillus oceanisediminis]
MGTLSLPIYYSLGSARFNDNGEELDKKLIPLNIAQLQICKA